VIDGVPMMRVKFSLASVAAHCVCANCGESQVAPASPEAHMLEVEVMTSATVGDRIRAMDLLAKYGLGTSNEEKIEVRDGDNIPTAAERSARTLAILKRA
jgi:hypothetical protein